jgi:hypothetical protein
VLLLLSFQSELADTDSDGMTYDAVTARSAR